MTRFLQELSFTRIKKHIDLTIEQLSDKGGCFLRNFNDKNEDILMR